MLPKNLLFVFILLLVSLCFSIPHQINYQGKLTNSSGVGIDGTVSIEFRIYNVSSGGSYLWNEVHGTVSVTRGLFDVVLGETTPIDLSFDEQYYLELVVNGEVLSPRIPLNSVGYSYRSEVSDSSIITAQSYSSHYSDSTGAVSWSDISSVPVGFADGVDDVDDADNVVGNEVVNGLSFDSGTGDLSLTQSAGTSPLTVNLDGRYLTSEVDGSIGNELITSFTWTDSRDSLQITEAGVTRYVTIDNEADDLSDNVISDLLDVSSTAPSSGEVLKWNGTAWAPAFDDTGSGGGITAGQWHPTASYIYPDSVGDASGRFVRIYNEGRLRADASSGIVAGEGVIRGDVSGTVWGALGYYDGTNYYAGHFYGDVDIVNSGDLYISGQIYDGDASDPDVNIGEDLAVAGDISGNGDLDISGAATIDGSASIGGGAGGGTLNMNMNRIVQVSDPTASQDAATKNYVDANFSPLGHNHSHNSLTGIQGGSSGEYYHLTQAQYDALTNADGSTDDASAQHNHDGRYFTQTQLQTGDGSAPNVGNNYVSWENLVDVPSGLADGTDDVNTYTAGQGLTESPSLTFNVGAGNGISVAANSVAIDNSWFSGDATVSSAGVITIQDDAVQASDLDFGSGADQIDAADIPYYSGHDWNWLDPDPDQVEGALDSLASKIESIVAGGGEPNQTITTGAGCTGAEDGTTGDVTIDVGAGTGITVNATSVSIDESWFDGQYIELTDNFGGDVSGTYDNIQIGSGVIGSNEIDDGLTFVNVQNNLGTHQFYVADSNTALRFEGTGYASVSFDASTHRVIINAAGDGTGTDDQTLSEVLAEGNSTGGLTIVDNTDNEVDINDALSVNGNLTVSDGNAIYVDNIYGEGSASDVNFGDNIDVNGHYIFNSSSSYDGRVAFNDNIVPVSSGVQDLGSASYRWDDIYLGSSSVININGDAGSSGEVLKINGSGNIYWGSDNTDDADADNTNELITSFTWTDSRDSLQITEADVTRYVTIDNEADDLSDN
ncbi:hypothetical protein J7M00_07850, partial [bacterium]|nr:hypothetical protein [bacterium]